MVRLDWGKKREYNKKARIGAEQGKIQRGGNQIIREARGQESKDAYLLKDN